MSIGNMRVSKADGSQPTYLQRDALVLTGATPLQVHYTLDNVESDRGLRYITAAVFNHANQPVAAIRVPTLKSQVDYAELEHLGTEITAIAREISRILGASVDDAGRLA